MRLFSLKIDPVETYIRTALEANGFNFDQAKVPLFKMAETIHFPTAFFSVERLIVREQLQKGDSPFGGFEEYEVFYNDNRDSLKVNKHLCDSILDMLARLKSRGVSLNTGEV